MLALLGATTIAVLLALILFNRCSPLVALILVPAAAGLLGGFGRKTADFMVEGVTGIAPVAAMFVFAIVFFGVLTDAGLLDPILGRVLRFVGLDPKRIVLATALLALLIHLDGSGAVCFLVVIPAMRPVYERVGIDRRILACVVSMAAGVNFLPWTGPTLRAAAALKTSTTEIFRPLIAVQAVGLAFVFAAAWWLGRREAHRLGARGADAALEVAEPPSPAVLSDGHQASRRPRNFWANLTLTLVVVGVMVAGLASPAVVFMLGTATALIINYPGSASQRERVDAHARSALSMAAILLAAGAFTGVMSGTGALKALAQSVVAHVPAGAGRHLPFGLALIAMPLSLLFDPDSFYFGVLPVIAETYRQLGGEPLHMAQAALVGQMTAGFPISPLTPATFLVAGLAGVDLSAHQRFAFPFLYAASLVMAVACVFLRVFSA